MKTVDAAKAQGPLAGYARRVHQADEAIVVVDDGKPIAVVVPVEGGNLEALSLSTNPEFIGLLEASRRRCPPGRGISLAEVERRLATDSPSRRAKTRAAK